jgi:hypothetical protein
VDLQIDGRRQAGLMQRDGAIRAELPVGRLLDIQTRISPEAPYFISC